MPRVSWIFKSIPYFTSSQLTQRLQNNPVEFALLDGQPKFQEYNLNDGTDKIVFAKKYGDPRLIHHHKFQLSYSQMDKSFFDIINGYTRFFGYTLYMKIWQFDAKYDVSAHDNRGAVHCWPSDVNGKREFYTPYMNISDDDPTLTKVWVSSVNGTTALKTLNTHYTLDYKLGKITFNYDLNPTDVVSMNFVWKPKVRILSIDPRPAAGRSHGDPRFCPVLVVKEV